VWITEGPHSRFGSLSALSACGGPSKIPSRCHHHCASAVVVIKHRNASNPSTSACKAERLIHNTSTGRRPPRSHSLTRLRSQWAQLARMNRACNAEKSINNGKLRGYAVAEPQLRTRHRMETFRR
jgi:hypothetical protein